MVARLLLNYFDKEYCVYIYKHIKEKFKNMMFKAYITCDYDDDDNDIISI